MDKFYLQDSSIHFSNAYEHSADTLKSMLSVPLEPETVPVMVRESTSFLCIGRQYLLDIWFSSSFHNCCRNFMSDSYYGAE